MANGSRQIYVYADWAGLGQPMPVGILRSDIVKGKEVFSFNMNDDWLKSKHFRMLDPDLQQYPGLQYIHEPDKSNFGLFLDSSPDRWGRMLMRRREAILARQEGRNPHTLHETDYLLGVYDKNRMGALRFKLDPDGEFVDSNAKMATPPWTSLRDLEYASLQLERNDIPDDPQYAKWLQMLIAQGSSLGGARPKANVIDNRGNLWIAKFPSRNDSKDVGAWEKVTNVLAKNCGIETPESDTRCFLSKQHTYLSKRFDRNNDGSRIHFASAMTLLGLTDGADHTEGISYLALVELLLMHGNEPDKNLEQLWRRIVFNIAVSNCDDHLRNHGFLLTSGGWVLSPAYDINPDESGTGLRLNINEDDNSLDFDLAMSVASYFRISANKAAQILTEIKESVSQWHRIADRCDIPHAQQERMETAFRY